ncbi:MAG: hypothetical protein SF053_13100, partial [Bacteroidia bacterium]|nr:hypothetical protein [Bacteroidia bacterium]
MRLKPSSGLFSLLLLTPALLCWSQPVVNLGANPIACGSYTLDAGNPGAAYLWSTGDVTQTLTVTTSGIYWVDVTDINGTTRDSVTATIIEQPVAPGVSDITACGGGNITLSASSNAQTIFWYRQLTGGRFVAQGSTYATTAPVSTTYYAEAVNFGTSVTGGYSSATATGLVYQPDNRGLNFDVFQPCVLRTVTVFANNAGNFLIRLQTSNNTILDSVTVFLPTGGGAAHVIPLYFNLPVGTNLKLMGDFLGSGTGVGVRNSPLPQAFPLPVSNLLTIKSSNGDIPQPLTDRYYYFYDWVVTPVVCRSPRAALNVTVAPAPTLSLPNITTACNDTVLLDPGFSAGATYLWSTGDTTQTLKITANGTYTITATLGTCSVSDATAAILVTPPLLPLVTDTSVCGPGTYLLHDDGISDETFWYTQASGGRAFARGKNVSRSVTATSTYYAEAVNFAPTVMGGYNSATATGLVYQPDNRGLNFDVFTPSVLKSVTVFANNA